MRVQITERHCSIPDAIRERAEEQIQKLSKYNPKAMSADVVFTEGKRDRQVEVVLRIEGAATMVAEGEGPEFRTALDQVVERLSRMLRRQRDRERDHQAPPLSEHATSE